VLLQALHVTWPKEGEGESGGDDLSEGEALAALLPLLRNQHVPKVRLFFI
jgi:hypothetical protein